MDAVGKTIENSEATALFALAEQAEAAEALQTLFEEPCNARSVEPDSAPVDSEPSQSFEAEVQPPPEEQEPQPAPANEEFAPKPDAVELEMKPPLKKEFQPVIEPSPDKLIGLKPVVPVLPAIVSTPVAVQPQPVIKTDSNQRRSSRSIRRRRFDDEIVESSLGRSFSLTPSTPKSSVKAHLAHLPATSSPQTPAANSAAPPSASVSPIVAQVSTDLVPSPATPATPVSTSTHTPAAVASSERKRPSKGGSHKKRTKLKQSAAKDLGRWKPSDDLALVIGVMQTSDLKVVHTGVKFSCRFTFAEVQGRFWALMYDPAVNRVAMAAMRNLHPEMIAAVKNKALFSSAEEILLSRIPANSQPDLEVFQKLLDENASSFYESRTAKMLNNHWLLMRQYHLLPDQTNQGSQRPDQTYSLSDTEDLMRDGDLTEPRDDALCHEMSLADRALQRQVNRLEAETKQWSVAVEHVTGIGPVDFDNQTLAVLRGRFVRYLMRSREITLGRMTKDLSVDVDLSLEGPAYKVSRRQGTIRLRNNGDFFLVCEGKRSIMVDGKPLLTGKKTRLNNNSVMEIGTLRFTFLVNQELIAVIRQEAAKMNLQPLASTPQRA
ncbi:microspherule protein 1 [Neocloeon triangulifer]|uniref:microspherule protein 1 n=1 Tax=Neocloeon triangulifer TaxID=2078957 RepID=UPI00286F8D44|nr:microspherule protein 1 [Neocloeon triangulifer]XP_059477784.1 microspherule protein 1 [Neocloeon triangulifer]